MSLFTGGVSWSKLDVFERCAALFKYQYIDKRPEPRSPALEKGTRVHLDLDGWLKGTRPALPMEAMPMLQEMVALKKQKPRTEEEWAFGEGWEPKPNGFRPGDWLRAKIDALVVKAPRAKVIDFKSGKNRGAKGEQPRFYAVLTLLREPKVKVVEPEFWYVEHGVVATGIEVARSELHHLLRNYTRRLAKPYAEHKFLPTPGDHCRWCSFSKHKNGPCLAG